MRHGMTFVLVPFLGLGIVLGPAQAGSWALPDESRGARVAPLLLLSRPEIRDDLKLAPAQVTEVEEAIEDLHQKAAALKGKTGEAAVAQRRAVDEGQRIWLERHLRPEQVDRLAQLDLRWEGPAAMVTRPSVAKELAISDEQRAALSRAVLERKAHRDKARDAEQQFDNRVATILTDGQKLRWEQMIGPPLDVKTASASAR